MPAALSPGENKNDRAASGRIQAMLTTSTTTSLTGSSWRFFPPRQRRMRDSQHSGRSKKRNSASAVTTIAPARQMLAACHPSRLTHSLPTMRNATYKPAYMAGGNKGSANQNPVVSGIMFMETSVKSVAPHSVVLFPVGKNRTSPTPGGTVRAIRPPYLSTAGPVRLDLFSPLTERGGCFNLYRIFPPCQMQVPGVNRNQLDQWVELGGNSLRAAGEKMFLIGINACIDGGKQYSRLLGPACTGSHASTQEGGRYGR